MPQEETKVHGICRVRELPDQAWTPEEFRHWWCDERDDMGNLLHTARMSPKEKDRYTLAECENIITNNGMSRLLVNTSDAVGNLFTFTDVLDVNNGALSGVLRTDTAMPAGTSVRKARNGFTITGNQTDISFVYGSTDAVFTITNIAIWGHGATTTNGTGSIHTHAMFSYVHPAISVTFDYLVIYSN